MNKEYRIEKVDLNNEWDNFVKKSENGTVFSYSEFLLSLNINTVAYFCYKNQTIKAGVLLIENKKGDTIGLHDFVIYNGILFNSFLKEQNRSQINSEKFRITKFLAEELITIYKKVRISLHPSIKDIRPFLWINFKQKNLPRYCVDLRYTSYVNIEGMYEAASLEEIPLYKQASTSRRQEIRYGIKTEVETVHQFDGEKFIDFYEKTMNRQQIHVPNSTLSEMKNLIFSLNENDLGMMFISSTKDQKVGSMAYYVLDDKRAYFLFGANDPEMRNCHTGTMVLWDSFKILNKYGFKEIDLEGINSPNRGWFKLSFGGNIIPYFELSFIL